MYRKAYFLAGILIGAATTAFCADHASGISGSCKGYNVILIIADSLRPDYLGCYGNPAGVSPSIDALASGGAVFTNTFCQIPLTLPSVVSILTSLYPYSHNTIIPFRDSVPPEPLTVTEILKLHGYATAWIGYTDDPQTGNSNGALRGFDSVRNIIPQPFLSKNTALFLKDDTKNVLDFSTVFRTVMRLNNPRRPFFLVIHSYLPHEKFFPRYSFKNKFSSDISTVFKTWLAERRAYIKERMFLEDKESVCAMLGDRQCAELFRDIGSFSAGKIYLESKQKRSLVKNKLSILFFDRLEKDLLRLDDRSFSDYLALLKSSIYELDRRLIGELVEILKKKRIADTTVIIITADHGNEYREHGHIGHGRYVYDESLRIPLIILIPGFKERVTVDALTESIDIAPTLLDLLSIPVPYQMHGQSLLSLMQKGPVAGLKEYIVSQSVDGKYTLRGIRWKLLDNPSGPDELYDIVDDVGESKNVIDTEGAIADRLRNILDTKKRQLSEYNHAPREFLPEIDEVTRERLRNTGYW